MPTKLQNVRVLATGKFIDIMKDCAEARLVALDYKGTN